MSSHRNIDPIALRTAARRFAAALEPIAAQAYFSHECNANYAALGFGPGRTDRHGGALPDGPAYFTSRGSVLGQVRAEVVASSFAVFNPAAVVPAVEHGWSLTDADTICAARTAGAMASLHRLVGVEPDGTARIVELLRRATAVLRSEGRPLYAGVAAAPTPSDGVGAVWKLSDELREYRGDSHIAAWIAAGLDAVEIGLLSDLYWGLPLRSYSASRSWSAEQLDEAVERLRGRALIAGDDLTPAGLAVREAVEVATDEQLRPVITALGDDLEELLALIEPWGEAIRAGRGFPGPSTHDLAIAARPADAPGDTSTVQR